MDATLVDAFSHGLKVSTDKNDTSAPHPRFVSTQPSTYLIPKNRPKIWRNLVGVLEQEKI